MYKINKNGCPDGWAYVQDYMGNKCYYGPVRECKLFIQAMTEAIIERWDSLVTDSDSD